MFQATPARSVFAILLTLFLSVLSHAQTYDATVENKFPILQCPGSSEVFKNFRTKLLDLKKNIKANAKCDPVTADVGKLAALVTTQRPDFLKLITQGQSQGLTTGARTNVENYVEELTTTTSNLIDVISGNDACFEEDKQRNSIAFITSLIGEGSKILSLVGGPEGRTIALAADVVNGFLKGMEKIKANRRGYDFSNYDQRIAYTDALCSYFDYRRELDQLLDSYDTVNNLENLQKVVSDQLDILKRLCPECSAMIDAVNSEVASGKDTVALLWTEAFQNKMVLQAEHIDKLYKQKLGSHTYRALKTQTWIPERIAAVNSSQLHADLGLQDVTTQMSSIEDFIVDRQVYYFFDFHIKQASKLKDDLYDMVTQGRQLLYELKQPMVPIQGQVDYPDSFYQEYGWATEMQSYQNTEMFYTYAGAVAESLQNARGKLDFFGKAKVDSHFKELDQRTGNLKITLDVMNQYCMFFALAGWYNKPNVYTMCEDERVTGFKKDLAMFSTYSPNFTKKLTPTPLPAALPVSQAAAAADLTKEEQKKVIPSHTDTTLESGVEVQATTRDAIPENITQNWIQSLTSTLKVMNVDPSYTERAHHQEKEPHLPLRPI